MSCAETAETDRFAVWVVDLRGLEEAQVQSYLPRGANVPIWEGTLASSGEYDWTTVRLRRGCGLMSNYFDHLFYICVIIFPEVAQNSASISGSQFFSMFVANMVPLSGLDVESLIINISVSTAAVG